MNIVVLAGGISTERDVSIVSGTQVCKALRKKGHNAIILDVYFGNDKIDMAEPFTGDYNLDNEVEYIKSFNQPFEELQKLKRDFFGPNVIELCKMSDIVFLALHGENGENGKIQAAFDLLDIKYTGTGYLGSALAMDKGLSKKMLNASQVPAPQGFSIFKGEEVTKLSERGMNFPVVVKPCCGGSSVGVYIVNDQKEYEDALVQAFHYEDEVIVEDYIKGREFSVGVVDGKAYPIIEIAPIQGFYDYKNKYEAGSTIETCPAVLSEDDTAKMQKYAEEGYQALALDAYGRLDFLMRENGEMFCLEANTLPGMTPTSLLPQEAGALGMDFPELCEELIRVSMKKYQ